MKAIILIEIFLLNVLTSKKLLLLEVENVNDTKPGSDYSNSNSIERWSYSCSDNLKVCNSKLHLLSPEGDLGQRSVPEDMRLLHAGCHSVSSKSYRDSHYYRWPQSAHRLNFDGEFLV